MWKKNIFLLTRYLISIFKERNMIIFLKTLLYVSVFYFSTTLGSDCDTEIKNKYSEELNLSKHWKKIVASINQAQKLHVPCESPDCSCELEVMKQDLSKFDAIRYELLDELRENVKSAVTFQIIDGKLYRSRECVFPFRCEGIQHFLKLLAPNMPDTEFVLNTHDWPFMNKYFGENPMPLFSFSKTLDYHDIMYPAWSFWAGGPATKLYPTGLGRWDEFRIKLEKSSSDWPWRKKENKAFFRGSRTSQERDNLVLLSRKKPDLIDAKYTKNQGWKSMKDTLGYEPAEEIGLEEHCRYRFLFNFRGVAASFRFKHLFLCNSLVFHVGDEWLEYFYPSLKPWIHYVPVNKDADQDELEELISYFRSNPEKAQEIANRGHDWVKEHLKMDDIKCYWKNLLENYTKLLNFKPKRKLDLIEI